MGAAQLAEMVATTRPEHFAGRAWFKAQLFWAEKVPPMTVPLGRSGLIFWAKLGPGLGLGGPPAHFIM
jgi:hypothetical protein